MSILTKKSLFSLIAFLLLFFAIFVALKLYFDKPVEFSFIPCEQNKIQSLQVFWTETPYQDFASTRSARVVPKSTSNIDEPVILNIPAKKIYKFMLEVMPMSGDVVLRNLVLKGQGKKEVKLLALKDVTPPSA